MADNDKDNEEYHFSELDEATPEDDEENTAPEEIDETNQVEQWVDMARENVFRNALIAVGVVVALILIYKVVGSMFSDGKKSKKSTQSAVVSAPVAQKPAPVNQLVSEQRAIKQQTTKLDDNINKQLSALSLTHSSLRKELTQMQDVLNGFDSKITAINAALGQVEQSISNLSAKLDAQNSDLRVIMSRTKPKVVKHHTVQRSANLQPLYTLQAAIPGRAWIISRNGSTLTVSEGSSLKGYGVVKLIDPTQGRVLTSSGKVIRFSQQDR